VVSFDGKLQMIVNVFDRLQTSNNYLLLQLLHRYIAQQQLRTKN